MMWEIRPWKLTIWELLIVTPPCLHGRIEVLYPCNFENFTTGCNIPKRIALCYPALTDSMKELQVRDHRVGLNCCFSDGFFLVISRIPVSDAQCFVLYCACLQHSCSSRMLLRHLQENLEMSIESRMTIGEKLWSIRIKREAAICCQLETWAKLQA